jgi:hypothetical protein
MNEPLQQPREQLRYAQLLEWGSRLGLLLLVGSFSAYVLGWLPALVSPQRLPELWGQPVAAFLQHSGKPAGWAWLAFVGHGDVMPLLGIAVLASCSVPALLALLPLYAERRDWAFFVLCLAEAVVVLLAASGWLSGGHG